MFQSKYSTVKEKMCLELIHEYASIFSMNHYSKVH